MGVREIEQLVGHRFAKRDLLQEALTHSSMRLQTGHSYERLEFLGDAVLDLIVADHLFRACPGEDEGVLTQVKSAVVSGAMLSEVGRRLGLDRHARVDKGVARRGLPDSLVADLFEAVIGAIYLDAGMPAARDFILRTLGEELERALGRRIGFDAKSQLQQYAQRELHCDPAYRVLRRTGPAHERRFQVAVSLNGREFRSGWAPSKAAAEQAAAAAALRKLDLLPDEAPPEFEP